MPSSRQVAAGYLAVALSLTLGACGGGASSSTETTPPPASATITSVSVSCSPATIQVNQTSKCGATVSGTGTFDSSVTWSVDTGTVDPSGNYTAPASPTTSTVKATTKQDTSKFGSATIAVTAQSGQTLNPTGPIMVPPVLVSGQQAQVIVTSFVKGADLNTQVQLFGLSGGTPALIGTMKDDGKDGDQLAGDQVYAITTTLTGPAAASSPMRIVASASSATTASVDFSVQVAQIPSLSTNSDLNQAETQIYNTAIQTRGILSAPNSAKQTVLHDLGGNLISMFSQFEAVTNQDSALQAAKTESRSKALKGRRATSAAGTVGDILTSGLLSPAQNAVSCDQLIESLGGFRGSYPNALSLDDPRLQQFAQELTTSCSSASSCQGAFVETDFLGNNLAAAQWAHEYIISGQTLPTPISGCSGGLTHDLAGVAVKAELQQFTDLVGDAVGTLANLGQIGTQALGQATGYLVGWFVDNSGTPGIVIGQVAPNETFAAPTGTYDLAYSFGGGTPNATITNTPVYSHSTTFINPSPGASLSVTPPFITGFAPTTGSIGATVSISGTGFDTAPSGNRVTFNGTPSAVSNATSSSIQSSVPAGANSGPITVTTSTGATTSSIIFTVANSLSNPTPVITALAPNLLQVGATPQTLTINGSGFIGSSAVTVNQVARPSTFVSASQLTISLTSPDLSTVGTLPIVVTNPAPGGGSSNSVVFDVTSSSMRSVIINPSSVSIPENGVQTFNASVVGGGSVTWNVTEGTSGGTISSTGIYTAPTTTGTFHVVATNAADTAQSATSVVTVVIGPSISTLHSFNHSTEGANPWAALIQAGDGNFYGTTNQGGNLSCSGASANSGCGTIFKMDASGDTTLLHAFTGSPDGGFPVAALVQATDHNFYGTANYGGANLNACDFGGTSISGGCGAIFKIDSSGNLTVLYSFSSFSAPEGVGPNSALIQATSGKLYGDSIVGAGGGCKGTIGSFAANGCGSIFDLDTSGNLTALHPFTGPEGAYPASALVQGTDGNFYGVTEAGGNQSCSSYATPGCGTVFTMTPDGIVVVLHSFAGQDGAFPNGALTEGTDGNFYGTTVFGGNSSCAGGAQWPGCGVLFRIDSTGNMTVLHSFSGSDGAYPNAALLQASDGNLYGTTQGGGDPTCNGRYGPGCGTVFRMDSSGNITVLYSFKGEGDGSWPEAALIQGTDGNLYSTTAYGGTADDGVVFRISNIGSLALGAHAEMRTSAELQQRPTRIVTPTKRPHVAPSLPTEPQRSPKTGQ